MADQYVWPYDLLTPANPTFQVRPYSRGGGRSLGGVSRSMRTDRGYWAASYDQIVIRRNRPDQKRAWNALRVGLLGTAGLVVVPICASNLLGGGPGVALGRVLVPHDDLTPFDDLSLYSQARIYVVAGATAPLGTTIMTFKILTPMPDIAGMRFSYNHALYEIGPILAHPGADTVQAAIFPAIRQTIPANAALEFERPDCLMHLATDSEMDAAYPPGGSWLQTVNFLEAVDYWNDLALDPAGTVLVRHGLD